MPTRGAATLLIKIFDFGEASYQEAQAEGRAIGPAMDARKVAMNALLDHIRTLTTEDLRTL